MLLLRALNDYDIISSPLTNGISSKQMIYDLVKRHYENDRNNNKGYFNLNAKEKDEFIKGHIEEYLKSHNHKLEKIFIRNSNQSREDVREYRKFLDAIKDKSAAEMLKVVKNNTENINFGSYIVFMKYLSELQRHLLYGSTKITDWISASTNMESMLRYYDNQKTHRVAVIKSNTKGLVDSDDIMSVDLSTFEKINKNSKYLCNRIDCIDDTIADVMAELSRVDPTIMLKFKNNIIDQTDIKSRGFKYSTNSKEICMLRYIPKEHIISLLEALQIDLARCESFNENFVYKPKEEQENELNRFKSILFIQLKQINDPYLLFLFDELYMKNKNINDLVSFDQSKTYIENNRNKILSLSLRIASPMVKRKF